MQCWPAYLEETFFIYFYLHGYCLVQKLSHVFQLHCSRIWHVYLRTDHASTEDIIEYLIFYRNHIVSLLCFHIEIWCGTLNYMYIFFPEDTTTSFRLFHQCCFAPFCTSDHYDRKSSNITQFMSTKYSHISSSSWIEFSAYFLL